MAYLGRVKSWISTFAVTHPCMLEGLVKKSGAMNDIKKSKGDGDINNIKRSNKK